MPEDPSKVLARQRQRARYVERAAQAIANNKELMLSEGAAMKRDPDFKREVYERVEEIKAEKGK